MKNDGSSNQVVSRFKQVLFTSSFIVWGGGTLFNFVFTFFKMGTVQTIIFIIIAITVTIIFVYFSVYHIKRGNKFYGFLQFILPHTISGILVFLILQNHNLIFQLEEWERCFYANNFIYSGIETSMNKEVTNKTAKEEFEKLRDSIAVGESIDKSYIIGCWFSLKTPEESNQNCLFKRIDIKIKHNEYWYSWKLYKKTYTFPKGMEIIYKEDDFRGDKKYHHIVNIKCLNQSQSENVIFILIKNEESKESNQTWKYAIAINFSD